MHLVRGRPKGSSSFDLQGSPHMSPSLFVPDVLPPWQRVSLQTWNWHLHLHFDSPGQNRGLKFLLHLQNNALVSWKIPPEHCFGWKGLKSPCVVEYYLQSLSLAKMEVGICSLYQHSVAIRIRSSCIA